MSYETLLIIVPLIVILGYIGIVVANNRIAGGLLNDLVHVPLPPQTELMDTCAIAGKMGGN